MLSATIFNDSLLISVASIIILLSVVLIVIAIIILLVFGRGTREERAAKRILGHVKKIKSGKVKPVLQEKEENIVAKQGMPKESVSLPGKKEKLVIKKEEFSLKQMLVKKFKPIIEKQLKTEIEIIDFNAKEDNFLALINVGGAKLLLVLDSSGKIIDYKKQA